MGDDPGYGVTATVVLAEDLAEKAPDGGDGTEHSVAILDAMLIESVEDAGFAQGVGERQSLVRAKRARTSFRVVIGESQMPRVEVMRTQEARSGVQSGERSHEQESPPTSIIRGKVQPGAPPATSPGCQPLACP